MSKLTRREYKRIAKRPRDRQPPKTYTPPPVQEEECLCGCFLTKIECDHTCEDMLEEADSAPQEEWEIDWEQAWVDCPSLDE